MGRYLPLSRGAKSPTGAASHGKSMFRRAEFLLQCKNHLISTRKMGNVVLAGFVSTSLGTEPT